MMVLVQPVNLFGGDNLNGGVGQPTTGYGFTTVFGGAVGSCAGKGF